MSPQDRWEEDPGYSPFSVGAEIAALLAADLADVKDEAPTAKYLREIGDDALLKADTPAGPIWHRYNDDGYDAIANQGGLISEQVWDSPDIPEHELRFGRPSGSAIPLVWAHAEHLKEVRFTLYWPDAHHWQGADFGIPVGPFKREIGAYAGQD